jgi:hypothetical protein
MVWAKKKFSPDSQVCGASQSGLHDVKVVGDVTKFNYRRSFWPQQSR